MRKGRRLQVSVGPLIAVALVAIGAGGMHGVRHLALQSSMPEADTTVESPSEVLLKFTQEPQEGTTSIRLLDAHGDLVASGETAQSTEDPTVFTSSLEAPLGGGVYTVAWRAMAEDGHVVAEEFAFTVGTAE